MGGINPPKRERKPRKGANKFDYTGFVSQREPRSHLLDNSHNQLPLSSSATSTAVPPTYYVQQPMHDEPRRPRIKRSSTT